MPFATYKRIGWANMPGRTVSGQRVFGWTSEPTFNHYTGSPHTVLPWNPGDVIMFVARDRDSVTSTTATWTAPTWCIDLLAGRFTYLVPNALTERISYQVWAGIAPASWSSWEIVASNLFGSPNAVTALVWRPMDELGNEISTSTGAPDEIFRTVTQTVSGSYPITIPADGARPSDSFMWWAFASSHLVPGLANWNTDGIQPNYANVAGSNSPFNAENHTQHWGFANALSGPPELTATWTATPVYASAADYAIGVRAGFGIEPWYVEPPGPPARRRRGFGLIRG